LGVTSGMGGRIDLLLNELRDETLAKISEDNVLVDGVIVDEADNGGGEYVGFIEGVSNGEIGESVEYVLIFNTILKHVLVLLIPEPIVANEEDNLLKE
jgi:hypothetical protein